MQWVITILVMLSLSVICGGIIVLLLKKNDKCKGLLNTLSAFAVCGYCEFWMLNFYRVALFQKNTISVYSENIYFVLFDVIICVIGSVFVYRMFAIVVNEKFILIQLCFVVIYNLIMLFYYILQYGNINAAIYEIFKHDNQFICGLVLIVINLVVCCVCKYNHYKVDKGLIGSVVFLFVISMVAFPACEVYISNINEFSFRLSEVLPYYIACIAIIASVTYLLLLVISRESNQFSVFLIWSVSIAAYIQSMFMNGKLFEMDGKSLDWDVTTNVLNLTIWFAILFGLLIACTAMKNKKRQIIIYSSLILSIMQITAICSLVLTYISSASEQNDTIDQKYFSTEGLYEVATDENIIIFVLDTYDVDFMSEILEEYPNFLSQLGGFVYYPDMVSQYSRTDPSITYMLTGETYFYEITHDEYTENAFSGEDKKFWKSLRDNGYKYYLFEDDETMIGKTVSEGAENYVETGNTLKLDISLMGCMEAITRINGYKLVPYALKNYYTYTADSINTIVVKDRILDKEIYVENDAKVYRNVEQGITISNDDKAFRFIHLVGAHQPFVMNEDGMVVDECAPIKQYIGTMKIVFNYIEQLKNLGVFEKATIVITADHGDNLTGEPKLNQNTNPILFIKPTGVDDNQELTVSDFYAAQSDIIPTISLIYGIDCNIIDGMNILDTNGQDKERVRSHYFAAWDKKELRYLKYEIMGSSLNFNNWIDTGEYIEFGNYY